MASNAAVPFWRAAVPFWIAAEMTYISYSNICENLVKNCLKKPHKPEALSHEKVHFSLSKWVDGKPQKPRYEPELFHGLIGLNDRDATKKMMLEEDDEDFQIEDEEDSDDAT